MNGNEIRNFLVRPSLVECLFKNTVNSLLFFSVSNTLCIFAITLFSSSTFGSNVSSDTLYMREEF